MPEKQNKPQNFNRNKEQSAGKPAQAKGFAPSKGRAQNRSGNPNRAAQPKDKANAQTDRKQVLNARGAAVELLLQVLEEGAYTNIALNKYLRSTGRSLETQERRLLTELLYGTVKAVGTIDWYLAQCVTRPLSKLDKVVLAILRLSAYQLLYVDRIPDSAACNEAVKLARALNHEGGASLTNAVLRSLLRKREAGQFVLPKREEDEADYLSLVYCHPRWLVKKWLGQFGSEGTEKLLQFNNTAAPICMRTNTLVMDRQELQERLTAAGAKAEPSAWSKDGLICQQLPAMEQLFKELQNAFYIQDESSMAVAAVVNPQPGMRVLDMCSAPGGKSTHMAQLMENKGLVVACDVHPHKLRLIAENAQRLGLKIISTRLQDGTVLDVNMEKSFDRVLVDAPCSGLGVLRRRAEARWRKDRKELKLFPPLQLQILRNGARCVADGGLLVYSTCTIEQSENHYLVEEFLRLEPTWERAGFMHPVTGELVEELQLLPQEDGTDGFYICALRRKK